MVGEGVAGVVGIAGIAGFTAGETGFLGVGGICNSMQKKEQRQKEDFKAMAEYLDPWRLGDIPATLTRTPHPTAVDSCLREGVDEVKGVGPKISLLWMS